jgi:hypothetical protein
MKNPVGVLWTLIDRFDLLRSDERPTESVVKSMRSTLNLLIDYVEFLRALVQPGYRDTSVRVGELPRLHERLNHALRVDWPTDASALVGGAERVVLRDYYWFIAVIAQAILLTIRQSSQASVRVAYQLGPDRLVGQADVSDAAGVDPDGWNLVRLASAVYGMPVAAEAAAGTLTVRWEFPLR